MISRAPTHPDLIRIGADDARSDPAARGPRHGGRPVTSQVTTVSLKQHAPPPALLTWVIGGLLRVWLSKDVKCLFSARSRIRS